MGGRKNQKTSAVNIAISVLVVLGAFWYFSSTNEPVASKQTAPKITANPETATGNSASKKAPVESAAVHSPSSSAANPSSFPAAIPADRVTVTEQSGETQLPPDLQAQINAAPPELPEDLKRQLTEPPPELPADLKAQLSAPPPEIPEDIKRALQTPPRIVTIDEVNNPKLLEKNAAGPGGK